MKINKEEIRKLKASIANILLFLSIFFVLFPLAMPNVSASGGTIYVDDDFPGNDEDNNIFDNIGDAVLHARDYHTGDVLIRVYNGTYLERVTIGSGTWNTLTLEGNHSSNTTIDAQGTDTVITISASWVNVTGFTHFGLLSGLLI